MTIFNFHELDIFLLVSNVADLCPLTAAGLFAERLIFQETNYVF